MQDESIKRAREEDERRKEISAQFQVRYLNLISDKTLNYSGYSSCYLCIDILTFPN